MLLRFQDRSQERSHRWLTKKKLKKLPKPKRLRKRLALNARKAPVLPLARQQVVRLRQQVARLAQLLLPLHAGCDELAARSPKALHMSMRPSTTPS